MIENNAKYQTEEKKPDIFKHTKKECSIIINNNTENFIKEIKIKRMKTLLILICSKITKLLLIITLIIMNWYLN